MNHNPYFKSLDTIRIPLLEIGGRSLTLGTVLASTLIMIVALIISRVVQRGIARALDDNQQSVHAASRLTHYAIMAVGFSIALQTAGIDLRALFAAGAVFAIGIGFAMQTIMQNFVSGVILLVEHSIRPGDVLDIEGRQVRVIEMGIRSTRVRSRDDEVLIVPNSTLVQSTVRSYTLLDTLRRVRVTVGVSYDSDMQAVREALLEAGRAVSIRNLTKEPLLLLTNFSPSTVDWEISIRIDDAWELRPAGSALREAVWRAFSARNIHMSFPQLDVHLDAQLLERVAESVDKVVDKLGPRAA